MYTKENSHHFQYRSRIIDKQSVNKYPFSYWEWEMSENIQFQG